MLSRLPIRPAPLARSVGFAGPSRQLSRRFQSSQSQSGNASGSQGSSHLASGLAGGLVAGGLLYGIYNFSPSGRMARKINTAAREADKKYREAAATIKDKTPTTDAAIAKIKEFCYTYVAWVPGGRQFVDSAFDDLDSIRENHGKEVDGIVSETYQEFQEIARGGLSLESATKAYDALGKLAKKIARLSGSASDTILERHPQLNDKLGEPIRQLQQMGTQYGPEAKKLADETWKQVNDVLSSGFSAEGAEKVRKIVEERTQQIRKAGNTFWDKSLEQARPYLDKSPRLKQLVTDNQDLLKNGDVSGLFKKLKGLGEGADAGQIEEYVKEALDKAKKKGAQATGGSASTGLSALSQFFEGSSSADDAGRKLQDHVSVLSKVINEHGDDGKALLEETKEELRKLLEEKAKRAQKILDEAKRG
ncbi:hypothetical protein B0J18DRAFT_85016 [Chaetomium sp. MPI-SDFR-AT-0129]|nr:hypothetical protein B0J18DRAFT_85016 [Chaetomium sp. MPI-SDFR-AT-0129]